jgi:hypothetical protein
MDDAILQRVSRIYAAIGAIEEIDPKKLRATVVETETMKAVFQDFRGGLSDAELSNQAQSAIGNIANLRDHLRRWAVQNGHDKGKVDRAFEGSFELQVIQDLSNNDKHGYPPRSGSHSGKSPHLTEIHRVMRLQTQAKEGSAITMAIGPGGVPEFIGDGSAKAVVTGQIVDNSGNHVADLYEVATKAVEVWERLLVDLGLLVVKSGT